ncbi:MAG: DUF4386 domain-containing protein [Acidobacteriota bacterium]|nr:DUF4386 domain-containing protein [Acidobacteriota bacterium]
MNFQPRSPRLEARVTGVLYLCNMLTGIAAMILISRRLQSAGDAMNLAASVLYTVVTLLLWHLFRPVSSWMSAVAAALSLLGCWLPLSRYEAAFPPLHITNFAFFGLYCLLTGYLIVRSAFMPNFVGVLMACAGVCWMTTLLPSLTHVLGPVPMAVGIIGEGTLIVYLIWVGLNERRWQEQAHGTSRDESAGNVDA